MSALWSRCGSALGLALGVVLAAAPARAAYYATITIDGNKADWAGLFQFKDAEEPGVADGRDIDTVFFANDATYFYFGLSAFADLNGGRDIRVFIDRGNDTVAGVPDANDVEIILSLNGSQHCQNITVIQSTTGAVLGTPGCGTTTDPNAADNAEFIEARVSLAILGLPVNPVIGVAMQLIPGVGTTDSAPATPFPTTVPYDNTGTSAPTFIRVRELVAEGTSSGVAVRWSTSAEWSSAGTWVLRQTGADAWQPVQAEPVAAENELYGAVYRVFDAQGRPGDVYALAEVDERESVTLFGPVTASAAPARRATATAGAPRAQAARAVLALEQARSAQLAARVLRGARGSGARATVGASLEVRVTREGLYVVCDAEVAARAPGTVASQVSLRGEPVASFRVGPGLAPCAGRAFYAPPPSSPHAPYEVYRLVASPPLGREAEWVAPRALEQGVPVAERAYRRARVMPRRYLDMGDGTPNRFFWRYASPVVQPQIVLDLPDLSVGARFDVTLAVRANVHASGAVHGVRLSSGGEARVVRFDQAGWQTLAASGLVLADAGRVLRFGMEATGSPYEGAFLADAEVRYLAPVRLEGGLAVAEPIAGGWLRTDAAWGVALAVDQPLAPEVRATAVLPSGELAVAVEGGDRRILVAESFVALSPSLVERDERLDDPSFGADYLVLAPADVLDVVAPLVAHREARGLTSAAVSWEAVFARFAAGNPDPSAVDALLDWAAQVWRTTPRYLVLVGEASADPYGYTGAGRLAEAPVGTLFHPRLRMRGWSDALLVDPDAGRGAFSSKVAVGRLPSSDPAELTDYVQKVLGREGAAEQLRDVVVLDGAAGRRDPRFSVIADGLAALRIPRTRPVVRLSQPSASELAPAWARSRAVVYVGHGDALSWAGDLVSQDNVEGYTSVAPPLVLSTGCLDGSITGVGLAWSLARAPSGRGAIGSIAPTSLVDPNEAAAFIGAVLASRGRTWGDAWVDAQTAWTGQAARSMVLIGDPAAPR